jgi:hypothetical protein
MFFVRRKRRWGGGVGGKVRMKLLKLIEAIPGFARRK